MKLLTILLTFLNYFYLVMGLGALNIDEVLNAKNIFGDEEIVVPAFSVNAVDQAVQKFSAVLSVPETLDFAYENYATKFKKDPDNDEKKETFKSNLLSIFGHNLEAKAGRETYEMGVNKFSDMTTEEVIAKYTGVIMPNKTTEGALFLSQTPSKLPSIFGGRQTRAAPDSRDWRQNSVITKPKNQGNCGSCTVFAVTGALEAAMGLYKGKKGLDLSEQELLDCPSGDGIGHCEGNWPEGLFKYQQNPGQGLEKDYKYESKQGSCRANSNKVAKVTNYYNVNEGDEDQLKEYVGTYGVCTIVMEINDNFFKYKSGVFNTPCSNTRWDHSLLAVGYGNEDGQDYWIVKNSWGDWGDKGFIKVARNANSLCRIADYARLVQA